MNDNVDVKRHMYLRIVAKQNGYAQFDLATLADVSSNTSPLVSSVCIPPLVQAQQWFGVALDPTVRGGRVKSVGRLHYTMCLAYVNQICIVQSQTIIKRKYIEFSLILIYIKF